MMNTLERQAHNAQMMLKIYIPMRRKISAIVRDMEGHGWQPKIDSGVWRSANEQARKVRDGYSTVRYSFHNVTTNEGRASSLAVDLIDVRWGWESPQAYWLQLAAAARAHGLETGILWGLMKKDRAAIDDAIAARLWDKTRLRLGWDPAHIQPVGITLASAKRGARPSFV